jgi:hypothetical protein
MDWPLYERIISQLFEPLAEGDGIPDDELDTAEAQLGQPLPPLLRQLYNLCGRRGDLHRACEDIILPAALQVQDGYLPFYQNTVQGRAWAVPLNHSDDPPVLRQNGSVWDPDYPSLSQFLFAMLFWQAANGGADYYSHGTVPRETRALLATKTERISLGGHWKLEALWREGLALVYSTEEQGEPCPVLCAYKSPSDIAERELPGAIWETGGRRKAQVRYRDFDLSQRCAGCGRSKLTWADTSRGVCARCGHAL